MADIERIADWLIGRANTGETVRRGFLPQVAPHLGGTVQQGQAGECLAIMREIPYSIPWPSTHVTYAALLSELRLLFGIGTTNARKLRAAGFNSIHSLLSHPRWGQEARALLAFWQDPPRVENIYQTLSYWLPSSHRLFLMLPSLVPPDRTCFFDLETIGLFGSPIFLGGIGRPQADGTLHITQFLARDLSEEVALLDAVGQELSTCRFLVTYNGKAFDWTCMRERCAYYALPDPPELLHLDLLAPARRLFRDLFPDTRLETLERELLGIARVDDLPSSLVPRYYTEYLETGDPRLLIPIVNHNRQDVLTLVALFSYLVGHETG